MQGVKIDLLVPGDLLHFARDPRRDGKHTDHEHRRAFSGAFPHLPLRHRRGTEALYLLRRPDDPEHAAARGGGPAQSIRKQLRSGSMRCSTRCFMIPRKPGSCRATAHTRKRRTSRSKINIQELFIEQARLRSVARPDSGAKFGERLLPFAISPIRSLEKYISRIRGDIKGSTDDTNHFFRQKTTDFFRFHQ